METHKFPYDWTLKDANFTKDKGKVFSCFACGGGSTMGYKLAGFDVIGCNEIDPRMMKIYIENHNPKYSYCEDIRTFKLRDDLPEELYQLDILDGSPPCSSFSSSGRREKDWGKEKKFREGQTEQVLDTLFFDFIDLAKKLQPKVVIAENVKGLTTGSAKEYMKRIYASFEDAGYNVQHFILDSSKMGVPQKRIRVFFLCVRNDISHIIDCGGLFNSTPIIDMDFNEPEILFSEIADHKGREITATRTLECWKEHIHGEINLGNAAERLYGKRNYFDYILIAEDKVCPTLTIGDHNNQLLDSVPRYISVGERVRASSFPADFKGNEREIGFCTGMCVPPVMIAQIASRIYEQWLSKLKNE